MAVYVDCATTSYRGMKMCHMLADTLDELHAMADLIRLKRCWFQVSNSGVPHYDICQAKRQLALRHGATIVSNRELVLLMRKLRATVAAVDPNSSNI